jgi:putative transposase
MADTYSQIFYHVVFGVRNRQSLIIPRLKEPLYRYMTGVINNQKQKLFIVNGVADHVHLLLNCRPDMNLSHLVKEVKEHSTKFINNSGLVRGNFNWQGGFGAFSVSKREVGNVLRYIQNQEEHHKIKTFRDEYDILLKEHEVNFKEKYLLDFELEPTL